MIEKRAPSDSAPIHRHRKVLWLGVFALLLSLLGPVIAIQSTAAQENLAQRLQGEPPDCDPGFVVDEATNTCVVDPAAQQQEEQQQQEVQELQCAEGEILDETGTVCIPDPALQEVQELQCAEGEILDETGTVCIPDPALQEVEPAYIQIDKYDCPEGADWSEPDYQQLAAGCPTNQTPVNMTVNGELQSITSTGTWGPYEAPAAYNMNEEEREGYEMPHWFCGSPETTPTYVGTMYGVSGQVPEGESLYCQVFNYQQADEYSEILIEKYWCPEGYVPQGTESQADMMAACQDSGPGTTFDLEGGGQQWPQGMVPGQPGGTAYWDQLPQDTYTMTESGLGPDWYAQVYCHEASLLPNGAAVEPQMQQLMGDGKSIQWSSQPNYLYACAWFNLHEQPYAQIQIEKYWCNEGYVPADDAQQSDIMGSGECQVTGEPTTFSLDGPGGPHESQMVDGSPGGLVNWPLTEGGIYTVTEDIPNAAYTIRVYCHTSPLAPGEENGIAPQEWEVANGNSFQWDAEQGYYWICFVFNFPHDDNSVTVYKWDCEPGTEYGREHDYYQGGLEDQETGPCETEHLDVPMTLIDANGDHPMSTQANGTQWDGVMLDNGSFQLVEEVPGGYGDPMVFCGTLDEETQSPVTATGGMVTITPSEEPFTYQCNWYNIPENDYNWIDLFKYECPTEAPEGVAFDWYAENCTPVEGWNFNVGYEGGGSSQMTDDSGNASWSGVPAGTWNMSESVPEGYGEPVIWCRYVEWPEGSGETGDWTTYTPQEGYYESTFEEGNWHIECYWYNFPPEGEYILELNKYLCPAHVDPTLGLPDLGTSCMPIEGVSFTASFGATPGSARYTDMNGQILWNDAPMGAWSLQETTVPGWGPPKVYCGPTQTTEAPEVPVVDLAVSGTLSSTSPHIVCTWFNFELEYDDGRITIYKYQCPPGTTSTDLGILQESCVTPFNGLGFTLQTGDMVSSASTVGGTVDWYNLGQGSYTVTEQPLPGYAQPLVWCGYVTQDGVDIDPGNQQFDSYPVTEGAIQLELNNFPARIICYWYNFPTDPGEITIYKWLCPPGYDIGAWGADPTVDCITPYNGVTFTLDQPQGVDLMTDTGDSVPGAVYFGGLNPGAYTVTETVPPDIQYVFVLDCVGNNIPKVHPYPLSWGNKLDLNVASGDEIVCNWYNVPYPEFGWLTVYKYQCWTKTFTKHVDCEIYEHGASFELFGYPSQTSYGVGTTNNGGRYTWYDLQPGAYTLSEFSHTPCKITSTKTDGQGHAQVDTGQETVIRVYNCSTSTPGTTPTPTPSTTTTTTTTPKAPGKVPGKYPNTGVDPNQAQDFMPSVAALQDDPEGTPQDDELVDAYYRISCLDEPLEPLGTPTEEATEPDEAAVMATEEPEEFDLDFEIEDEDAAEGDLEATPGDEEDCPRGALPERVVVEAASVDAGVETLEIIDGIMEQPTGPELVTWYKETGRLGENNNVVIAGHLNWWNVPEGVFYRLQDLQEGDRVEITGDDGRIYVYEVEWVRQESNLEPPAPEVIGPTDDPTLTLITCGGEWNADVAEYDERTVAHAVQVDVLEPEATADGAAAYTQLLAA